MVLFFIFIFSFYNVSYFCWFCYAWPSWALSILTWLHVCCCWYIFFFFWALLGFNWSLFRFHYVAYIALIYLIPPQVLFTSLSPWIETWDTTFCWFILFPPLVLCFFFPLFLVLITSTTQTNFSSPSAHFPINPLPHPSLSSFLSTFSRAGNLGHAWPPCPRQPRYTRSYSLASRRVHACPEANTL